MLKIIVLLILLLVPVEDVLARRNLTVTPSPFTDKDTSITIQLTASHPEEFFNQSSRYYYQAWKSTSNPGVCGVNPTRIFNGSLDSPNTATISPDGKTLTASWELDRGCQREPGTWIFTTWTGDVLVPPSGSEPYSFVIKSTRDLPSISPGKSVYQINEKPIEVVIANARDGYNYHFWWNGAKLQFAASTFKDPQSSTFSIPLGNLIGTLTEQGTKPTAGTYKLCMEEQTQGISLGSTTPALMSCTYSTNFTFKDVVTSKATECKIVPENPNVLSQVILSVANVSSTQNFNITSSYSEKVLAQRSSTTGTFSLLIGEKLPEGAHSIKVTDASGKEICSIPLPISSSGPNNALSPRDCTGRECATSAGERCNTQKNGEDDVNGDGIKTAIGCVPTDPKTLINGLLKVGAGAGGGISLLLMIAGAFQMITSAGDQNRLQAAREQFTNAVIGLLFILFSVLLLRIIGVDILQII